MPDLARAPRRARTTAVALPALRTRATLLTRASLLTWATLLVLLALSGCKPIDGGALGVVVDVPGSPKPVAARMSASATDDDAATAPAPRVALAEPDQDPAAAPRDPPGNEPGSKAADLLATPLLDAAIALARADHPKLDEAAVRARVATLADAWRALLPADPTPVQRAEAFATLLFEREQFSAVADLDSPEALHLDSVLARRQGYCLSLSVLALVIAEQLGEPLFGVAMPNHFLVRWDDGTTRRNLELTRRGAPVSDAELRASLGDFWHAGTLYLSNLGPAQVAAVLLHNRGFVASVQGRRTVALRDLGEAARLLPELPEIHRNLGVARAESGDLPGAITAFERALMLYPGDVDALLNLALARHALGDLPGALDELDTALLLAPGHPRATGLAAAWRAAHSTDSSRPLDDPPPGLRPGLLGSFHAGTDLGRELAQTVASALDFDWKRGRPLSGVPSDRFSARWRGWFRAPEAGLYTLFVVANDGVRVRLRETLVVDHWQRAGYTSWTGTGDVELSAGWHPIAVEYFDESDNARLYVLVSRDGDEYPLDLSAHLFHQAPTDGSDR